MSFISPDRPLPPLPKCIVVESRVKSRNEITTDLKASMLFTEIIVAKSLMDALTRVAEEEFDACVLGSSISVDKAIAFVEKSRTIENCQSMALVVVAPKGQDAEEFRKRTGAHGVIQFPYIKKEFIEQIVYSVVTADSKSEWLKIIAEINSEIAQDIKLGRSNSVNYEDDTTFIQKVSQDASTYMTVLSKGRRAGLYGITEDGNFTKDTMWAVQGLLEHIFKERRKTRTIIEFQQYIQFAILEWFHDMETLSGEECLNKFRSSLQSFLQASL